MRMRNSEDRAHRAVSRSNTTWQFHSGVLLSSSLLAGLVSISLLLGMAPLSQLLVDLVLRWGMVVCQPYFEIDLCDDARVFSRQGRGFSSNTLGHSSLVTFSFSFPPRGGRVATGVAAGGDALLCANTCGHKCFRPRTKGYSRETDRVRMCHYTPSARHALSALRISGSADQRA